MSLRYFKATFILTLCAATSALLLAVSGCSILPFSKSDNADKEPGFQKSVAPAGNLSPRPVEIAEDIEAILNAKAEKDKAESSTAEAAAKSDSAATALSERDPASEERPVETVEETEDKKDEDLTEDKKAENDSQDADEGDSKKKSGNKKGKGKRVLYKVRSGDTLMKIAFEKYGNLYRWRQIYEDNRDRLASWNRISVGMTLVLNGVEYVVIERNGKPYLIRKGDTLAKISNQLYGTPQYWKALWANNQQMIHDPNRIYAGFTLYYENLQKVQTRAPANIKVKKRTPATTLPQKMPTSRSEKGP